MGRRLGSSTRSTTSVVNAHTTASVAPIANASANYKPINAKTLASGALTQDTLKSLISITGPGRLSFLNCYTADTTSRTIRVKVVVDGVTAVDVTSAATTTSGAGIIVCGCDSEGAGPEIVWNSSLDVSIASSVVGGETDKLSIDYMYVLE